MHEVIGSIPIVSTKRKTDVIDVRFSFGDDLIRLKQLAQSANLVRIPAEERVKLACKPQGVEYCRFQRNAENGKCQLSFSSIKRTSSTSVFLLVTILFDRSNSRKARIWFAFPPKSASSSLVSLKAWNIAVLSGTLRMANANCPSLL